MSQPVTDLWDNVRLGLETRPTDYLLKAYKQTLDTIRMDDARQARLGTNYPGWAGTCGRPTAGLIRIILLLRGEVVPV